MKKKMKNTVVLWIVIAVPIIASIILGYVNFGPK
jgi:hypothetical protein